jgi:histidinol-phosphate aminotransferase
MRAWEKNIRKVEPYVPGEQPNKPGMIKLNTNENPYPPAPGVRKALEEFRLEALKLYPDPTAGVLVRALAEYHHLAEDQVFVGVGSDDVLAMAFLTFFNSDRPILFPDITYSFYDVWANLFQIPYQRPLLDENFRIRAEDYAQENGGVVIANPNAPTGVSEGLDFIETILKQNQDVIVIVDEAYVDFGGTSALELLPEYENLLVVRTFSKSRSMAGMRIGYALGNSSLIKAMNDVKYSYNSYTMNQTALALGIPAVKDEDYFRKTTGKIVETRERTKKALAELGFTFPDSKTNFIFATHRSVKAKDIFEKLREENIYVRYFGQPRIDNYLRITVGTDEEMECFLEKCKRILEELT